jgi:hypothetical protein
VSVSSVDDVAQKPAQNGDTNSITSKSDTKSGDASSVTPPHAEAVSHVETTPNSENHD